jgi:hypothetical protein
MAETEARLLESIRRVIRPLADHSAVAGNQGWPGLLPDLVGFSTYSGTVTAADDWDLPPRRKQVRPGLAGSYEALFH